MTSERATPAVDARKSVGIRRHVDGHRAADVAACTATARGHHQAASSSSRRVVRGHDAQGVRGGRPESRSRPCGPISPRQRSVFSRTTTLRDRGDPRDLVELVSAGHNRRSGRALAARGASKPTAVRGLARELDAGLPKPPLIRAASRALGAAGPLGRPARRAGSPIPNPGGDTGDAGRCGSR
jgi:hypothetical protein